MQAQDTSISVEIVAREQQSDGVVALGFARDDGDLLPEWQPGAHIDVCVCGLRIRQYSLAGDPCDRSRYLVGVLRDGNGSGTSLHLHDRARVGDRLTISPPRNHFVLEPAQRYIFVAGGIGITPLLPMVEAAAASGAQWKLLYCGRTLGSMAFRDRLARHGEQVNFWPKDRHGALDIAASIADASDETLVYACGPERLLGAVEAASAHLPSGAVHTERFSAAVSDVRVRPFDVVLAESGITLHVPADQTLLSVLEAAGIPVMTSCAEGTCGSCEVGVLEGVPDHRDVVLSAAARARGDCMMVCVSRARSPSLTLDL